MFSTLFYKSALCLPFFDQLESNFRTRTLRGSRYNMVSQVKLAENYVKMG